MQYYCKVKGKQKKKKEVINSIQERNKARGNRKGMAITNQLLLSLPQPWNQDMNLE